MSQGSPAYNPKLFNALPHFNISKQLLNTSRGIIQELGDVLLEHDVEQYFGVALLHKHFDLGDNECLIEEVNSSGSVLTPRTGLPWRNITPYLWRVSRTPGGVQSWLPLEFVVNNSISIEVRNFAKAFQLMNSLRDAIAGKLCERNAEDYFGLALLHRQAIQIDWNRQVLLETDDPTDRRLTVQAVDNSATNREDWTQTFWRFDKNCERNRVAGECHHGCQSHCDQHHCSHKAN